MRELLKALASFTWASSLFAFDQIGGALRGVGGEPRTERPPAGGATRSGGLDTSIFVVLGEGLAAGMGESGLCSTTQVHSFPAQMARQMRCEFSQPLLEAPGIGDL